MTVSNHLLLHLKCCYTVHVYILLQMWSDVPEVKKVRTAAEEEEVQASRDMASLEVSYV